jgi:hypothetical protein
MQIDNYISRIKAYKQYTKSTIDLNRRVLRSLNTYIKKHTVSMARPDDPLLMSRLSARNGKDEEHQHRHHYLCS